MVNRPSPPQNRAAALGSGQYVMAVTAIAGKMDLSCFEDAMLGNARVRALLSRVTVEGDKELDRYFPQSWPGRVRVRLNDGNAYIHEVIVPKGESANPMSEREVEDKFLTLAGPVLSAERAQSVVDVVKSLDRRGSLGELFTALDCRAT
jgi:2-methylcitrate dehydratase PrpD